MGEPPGFTPSHRVRLAAERERPGARPTDLTGGEVEIDDRRVLVGADMALIAAPAPQSQGSPRPPEAKGGRDDDLGSEPGDPGGPLGRVALDHVPKLVPPARMFGDVAPVQQL